MPISTFNNHGLYVEDHGNPSSPVVLLLHHGLGSVRAWKAQIPALVRAGFRVIAYDRWGYGGSDARQGLDLPSFTIDLTDLGGLVDQLNIHQVALVGHSDGGTIALFFAAQQPDRVSCIITVAAHIYFEEKMEPGIVGVRQAFEVDERFRMGLQFAHGEKFETVFHNWFDGWYRNELKGWDIRPVLGQIKCPVLVVQGEEDEHASVQHARDITASIEASELWLIPKGKHMLPQENAEVFNPRMIRFLKDHTGGEQ